MHEQDRSCVEACTACALVCNHCATACLQEPDVKMMARCIALDIDCAAMCELAAGAMARGSECAKTFCATCAEICGQCAQECGKHKAGHCQDCAEACRRCANDCQRMAA